MPYSPNETVLSDTKLLLGISDTTKDEQLQVLLRIVGTKVLNDTRQTVMPVDLEAVLPEIAADAYRLNTSASEGSAVGQIVGSISSISDNGQSVSYRDSNYSKILENVAGAMRNYEAQLARWRKPGW